MDELISTLDIRIIYVDDLDLAVQLASRYQFHIVDEYSSVFYFEYYIAF